MAQLYAAGYHSLSANPLDSLRVEGPPREALPFYAGSKAAAIKVAAP